MPEPRGPADNEPSGRLSRTLGALFLRLFGWRVEGVLPAVSKAVVIAAPHTSNWDLPFMLAVAYVLGVRPSWLGKREIFRWPFASLMRRLGGLPVDRRGRHNVVQQVVAMYATLDRLYVVIPPSATRGRALHWKSGFYHIARGAGVPIMCTFLDYERKVGGVGPVFLPSDDLRADMDVIRGFYGGVTAKYPRCVTPVRLLEEGTTAETALEEVPDGVAAPASSDAG
jgi:1-acyl-sn-glycerol-3-phosphate acyltransferase